MALGHRIVKRFGLLCALLASLFWTGCASLSDGPGSPSRRSEKTIASHAPLEGSSRDEPRPQRGGEQSEETSSGSDAIGKGDGTQRVAREDSLSGAQRLDGGGASQDPTIICADTGAVDCIQVNAATVTFRGFKLNGSSTGTRHAIHVTGGGP